MAKDAKPAPLAADGDVAAKDGSFTIKLPQGWGLMTGDSADAKSTYEKVVKTKPAMAQQMQSMAAMPAVLLIALDTSKLEDNGDFVDNVNVNVQPSRQTEWQESSMAEVTKLLKEGLGDPNMKAELVTVGGKKVFRYKALLKMGEMSYEMLGYQYLHDKQVYTVTVSCGSGKMADREKAFDELASSLKFKA